MQEVKKNEIGINNTDFEKISQVFKSHIDIETVILFGSRAKGNFKPYSDLDLTLI